MDRLRIASWEEVGRWPGGALVSVVEAGGQVPALVLDGLRLLG
ncbi:hypothetical protein [Streptomyces sp. NBC_01264]|nr:hypothetical protein [Streptomyces sp. NBC_01264]MCX4783853.1 hypothetical protein [Streptomyces sp. NBC_01264]